MFGRLCVGLSLGWLRGSVEVDFTASGRRVKEMLSYRCSELCSSHLGVSINAVLEGFEFLIDAGRESQAGGLGRLILPRAGSAHWHHQGEEVCQIGAGSFI